jgi:hypothetical protein
LRVSEGEAHSALAAEFYIGMLADFPVAQNLLGWASANPRRVGKSLPAEVATKKVVRLIN